MRSASRLRCCNGDWGVRGTRVPARAGGLGCNAPRISLRWSVSAECRAMADCNGDVLDGVLDRSRSADTACVQRAAWGEFCDPEGCTTIRDHVGRRRCDPIPYAIERTAWRQASRHGDQSPITPVPRPRAREHNLRDPRRQIDSNGEPRDSTEFRASRHWRHATKSNRSSSGSATDDDRRPVGQAC